MSLPNQLGTAHRGPEHLAVYNPLCCSVVKTEAHRTRRREQCCCHEQMNQGPHPPKQTHSSRSVEDDVLRSLGFVITKKAIWADVAPSLELL